MKKFLSLVTIALLGVMVVSAIGLAEGQFAVVLDVGGRGDLSFNDMGFLGAEAAAAEFNMEWIELQSTTAADYGPNLRNLARTEEYDLIIGVGYLFTDAMIEVAAEFPDQKFAIIDGYIVETPNVMSIVYAEYQPAALIGALAAMAGAYHDYEAAGVVLGMEISVLYKFEAGFRFGMTWGLNKYAEETGTAATVNFLYDYTGSFDDIALGKTSSEAMLAQGAVGIFNVAGPLGLGDHEAVAEAHLNAGTTYGPPYYFGVDATQDYIGNGYHGIASAMKHVDTGVYDAIASVANDTYEGGLYVYGINEGGGSISNVNDLLNFIPFAKRQGAVTVDAYEVLANWAMNRATLPEWIWDAIDELEAGIADGSIEVPTALTLEQMRAVRAQYELGAP